MVAISFMSDMRECNYLTDVGNGVWKDFALTLWFHSKFKIFSKDWQGQVIRKNDFWEHISYIEDFHISIPSSGPTRGFPINLEFFKLSLSKLIKNRTVFSKDVSLIFTKQRSSWYPWITFQKKNNPELMIPSKTALSK